MADPLSPIASVVSLVSAAVGLVQEVRKAREHVKGARMTLERVTSVLNTVTEDLDSVKSNAVLHTATIEGKISEAKRHLQILAQFFVDLEAKQQRGSVTKMLVALKTGDADDEALKRILSDLTSASNMLHMQISVLTSNIVGKNFLMTRQVNERAETSVLDIEETKNTTKETNSLVKNGFRCVLERLENFNTGSQLTGPRTICANTSDLVVEEMDDPSEAQHLSNESRAESSQNRANNLTWSNNQAYKSRVVAGNVGFEDNTTVSSVRSTVDGCTFTQSRYVGGHVGGSAANDFWKD